MKIEQDTAVQVHYKLSDGEGTVIDSSEGQQPLTYLHGHGNLVIGVENALVGLSAGAEVQVVVPAAEGYGEHDPELDVAIPLSAFPDEARGQLQEGVMFQGPHPTDETKAAAYTVIEVVGEEVRCTANHPLAGMTLHFELKVVDVRTATAEELDHGHVHGPGGHEH